MNDLCCYNIIMRGANQFLKNRGETIQQRGKQSEYGSNRMGHIKQTNSPYLSNISDGRQKWFQYLPNQNHISHHRFSSVKDQSKNDNYLQSLERRLEKLFKEEKEMLRQRHYKGQNNNESLERDTSNSNKYQAKGGPSYTIDSMQRKIRQLEEKYRKQESQRQNVQQATKVEYQNYQNQPKIRQKSQQHKITQKQRQKTKSQYSPSYSRDLLTQSVEQCVVKQKHLEEQVQLLKQSVKQIRENNEQLIKLARRKDEKRKHKHRTKQLLKNILHKLQFINAEIVSAKKREVRVSSGKLVRIQRDASELLSQFEVLRLQYKNLQQQRRKVQMKQAQLQGKIIKISSSQETPLP